ncbi:MipA/OmpV family protein [Permianibacter sp. IMCC34836]|uniref:MipA/OmpV family protein n=1 Tax=Permianibacter fluminis TaxID=2738515 RepID=UPI00155599C5|nr:MipA/OmpV family protein [Permianibacter fluminis]NQD35947.1 MipA/OmpV family protein [Permianibacter fluminis]
MRVVSMSLLGVFACAGVANAGEATVGLGAAISESEYYQQPEQLNGFPLVVYHGDRFFFEGTSFGYQLTQSEQLTVSLAGDLDFRQYDPEEARRADLAALDERKAGVLAGVRLEYRIGAADTVTAGLLGELTNRHHGRVAELGWKHMFDFGFENSQVFSQIGLRMVDADYNDYYFGVSAAESTRSGLAAYTPGAGNDLSVGGGVMHNFANDWQAMLMLYVRRYDQQVSDSPMVENASITGGFVGIGYRF